MSSFTAKTTGAEVVNTFPSSVTGKTFLITGPSPHGLGAQTALSLSFAHPKTLILAGRSLSKTTPVINEIRTLSPSTEVLFIELDLSSLASVRAAAAEINSKIERLDVVINNAGVMAVQHFTKSTDGIEIHFAANHIGHFLLTNLLMPKIFAAGEGARLLNVSSGGYICSGIRFEDWNFEDGKEYNPWLAYGQSKTANILFSTALAAKLKPKGVLAFSLQPGLVLDSKLQANVAPEMFAEGFAIGTAAMDGEPLPPLVQKTLEEGASTQVWAAIAPGLEAISGSFLEDCAVSPYPMKAHAMGSDNYEKLWTLSEELVGQKFDYA